MSILGDSIRSRRKFLGMSLRAVAKEAKISTPFLCDLEHGYRSAKPEVAERIARALKSRILEVLDGCKKCGGSGHVAVKKIAEYPFLRSR